MGSEVKQIKEQNIIPQNDKTQIRVISVFSDKGKTFQELMEDIIKNASCN